MKKNWKKKVVIVMKQKKKKKKNKIKEIIKEKDSDILK
jgi:hypothetical protein